MKNKIEEIRKERGIRQEDFAKMMGVSRQTISSLETGKYNPSIFLAYKIAKYFEMTIRSYEPNFPFSIFFLFFFSFLFVSVCYC